MKMKNLIFAAIIALGIGSFVLNGRGAASHAEYTLERTPEVIAVTFTSAWCSACKIIEPRLAKVIPQFSQQPVKFVEIDLTFGQRDEINEQARRDGVLDIYRQYKGATGFTLLVDATTGDVIDSLTINHSRAAMRAAISQSIARATSTTTNN